MVGFSGFFAGRGQAFDDGAHVAQTAAQADALLYVAAGVAALTLTATSKMWSSGGAASVAWLVLLGGAGYTIFALLWSARKN